LIVSIYWWLPHPDLRTCPLCQQPMMPDGTGCVCDQMIPTDDEGKS
jgi:hypothetical protein